MSKLTNEIFKEGKHEEYGAQRVFGSIGWGLFTILGGYLIDSYSQHLNGAKVIHFILNLDGLDSAKSVKEGGIQFIFFNTRITLRLYI